MEHRELSSNVLENGNILISYCPYGFKDTWYFAIIPFLLAFIAMVVELLCNHTFYSVIILFIAIVISLLLWISIRDRKNRKIENVIITRYLEDKIQDEIKSLGNDIYELEREYNVISLNDSTTYGKRSLTVLLSNGKNMVYNVVNPKMLKNVLMLEIVVKPDVC